MRKRDHKPCAERGNKNQSSELPDFSNSRTFRERVI